MRVHLAHHEVRTAHEQGWGRLANGDLLRAAEIAGFDVLVTADQSIEYQQNLKGRKLALVALGTNRLSLLKAEAERFASAVDGAVAGSYQFLEYHSGKTKSRPE